MKRKTPDSDQLERHVDELPKDLYKLGVQLQAHERDHVGQRFTTNPVRASARIISYIHRRVGHFCISTLLAFLLPSFLVLACGWEMFFGSDRSGSAGAPCACAIQQLTTAYRPLARALPIGLITLNMEILLLPCVRLVWS